MLIQYQSPIDLQTPEQGMTADTQNRSKNQLALKDRILKSENGFKELESKFNISLSQGDIVKSAVVDLENIVKEINKILSEIKRSSGHSQKHMQPLTEKIVKLVQRSNHMAEELKNSKIKTEHLKNSLEKTNSLSTKEKSPSNSKKTKILISEEGIEYLGVGEEDFTEDFEIPVPSSGEENFPRPEGESKKRLLLSISLVAIFTTVSLFAWYYFSTPKQQPPEGIIAQNIKPPTTQRSAQDILPPPSQIAFLTKSKIIKQEPKPSEPNKKISQRNKFIPTPQTITKKLPTPTDKSPAQRYPFLKAGAYTINVGSFKKKKRALDFAKKLQDKGYPSLISTAKKKKMYRVRVGAFSTYNEAKYYNTTLQKKEQLTTFISKIN